jgi:hypothetical protein
MSSQKDAPSITERMGSWFLPSSPDKHVFGILCISQYESPKVTLFGDLRTASSESSIDALKNAFLVEPHQIVLGLLSTGEKITLCRCHLASGKINMIGSATNTTICWPSFVLEGVHFENEEEVKFKSLTFSFTGFNDWLRLKSIDYALEPNEQKTRIEKLIIEHKPLENLLFASFGNDIRLAIKSKEVNYTAYLVARFLEQYIGSITVEDSNFFELSSSEGKSLFDYIKYVRVIQDFIVFATGQQVAITEMITSTTLKATRISSSETIPDFPVKGKVIVQNPFFSISQPEQAFETEEFDEVINIRIHFKFSDSPIVFQSKKILFYYADIQHQTQLVIDNWQGYATKLKPVMDRYLGLSYTPSKYSIDKFIVIAQCIEAFHRIIYGGTYISPEDYKKGLYQKFLEVLSNEENQVDRDFREALKSSLRHLYQISLRKRLKALIQEHKDCLPDHLFNSKSEIDVFINYVTNLRNELTHLNEEFSLELIIPDEGLDDLITKLEILLRACMLKLIGLDIEKIKVLVERAAT